MVFDWLVFVCLFILNLKRDDYCSARKWVKLTEYKAVFYPKASLWKKTQGQACISLFSYYGQIWGARGSWSLPLLLQVKSQADSNARAEHAVRGEAAPLKRQEQVLLPQESQRFPIFWNPSHFPKIKIIIINNSVTDTDLVNTRNPFWE